MANENLKKTALLAIFMCVVVIACLGTATYAWFTYNTGVTTDRITAKTGTAEIKLLLSPTKDPFEGKEEQDIVKVNKVDQEKLMPVSTSDLKTFVFNNGTKVATNEAIYHGRLYVKAEGSGTAQQKIAVYLDNTEALFVNDKNERKTTDQALLNAARIGILFEECDPVIVRLSENSNPKADQINNTYLNGSLVKAGNVLHMDEKGKVTAVTDTAIALDSIGIATNPQADPLAVLEINKVYQLDVFFYLEGTDPDCSNYIRNMGATMQLVFYGALTEE